MMKSAVAFITNMKAPTYAWHGKGLRHKSSLVVAWETKECCVLVRSDSGEIHVLTHKSVVEGLVYVTEPNALVTYLSSGIESRPHDDAAITLSTALDRPHNDDAITLSNALDSWDFGDKDAAFEKLLRSTLSSEKLAWQRWMVRSSQLPSSCLL